MTILESRKTEKNERAYRDVGADFLPLTLEIYGVTSETLNILYICRLNIFEWAFI
jgi:hypothetical protein